MELIINFYKSLDTLNLIIFWGIIIVIILLLIFSFILMNKNKKLKKLVDKNTKYEEDLPIKKEVDIIKQQNLEVQSTISKDINESVHEQENISKSIEVEEKFVAEEHVMEYNKDVFIASNINKANDNKEEKINKEQNVKSSVEMPTGPYQRNVLREMSLSQTSPIGINRQESKIDKKIEIAKDLEESLNNEQIVMSSSEEEIVKEKVEPTSKEIQVKKELTKIEDASPRRTEIRFEQSQMSKSNYEEQMTKREEAHTITSMNTNVQETPARELLNSQPKMIEEMTKKSSSEKYLEEVSRKLAEAEIPDDIERTNYELKQEEDAIISYKELMKKKDTIQTVDEEEAIISIEELMNRNNKTQETPKEESKLYNLSEEEENDNFIKELKQFRNDL